MADQEINQITILPRVERLHHSTRSAIADYLAGFGKRLECSLRQLRAELDLVREEIDSHERLHASRFNVFAYIDADENRLSDILRDLLDPKGLHGQGYTLLRLLMKRLGVGFPDDMPSKLYREETTAYLATNPLRRLDILIDFGTFGIGIENKPWAGEQHNQVQDYFLHLDRKYRGNFVLLYLSGSGELPTSAEDSELTKRGAQNQFRLVDYRGELVAWLKECIENCEAERVRRFLNDFHSYVLDHFEVPPPDMRG